MLAKKDYVNSWNGRRLTVHRSKGQNVSEIPLSKEARQHLEAYFQRWQQEGGAFTLMFDSPMFLCQDPKHRGERLGYKGLYRMSSPWVRSPREKTSDRTALGMNLVRASLAKG